MKPVSVSIDVPQERERVYAFLDVMANHERFTDHMLRDWTYSGPATGVGAKAHVINVLGAGRVPVDIEVVDAVDGRRTAERNVSAGGRRVGLGTYELADRAGAGTRVRFTYAWERAPLEDRLFAVMVRAVLRRGLRRSLQRLAGELAQADASGEAAGTPAAAGAPPAALVDGAMPPPSPGARVSAA